MNVGDGTPNSGGNGTVKLRRGAGVLPRQSTLWPAVLPATFEKPVVVDDPEILTDHRVQQDRGRPAAVADDGVPADDATDERGASGMVRVQVPEDRRREHR